MARPQTPRRVPALALLVALAALAVVRPTQAQSARVLEVRSACSDGGCVGVQYTPFAVDQDGGVLATGQIGIGTIPATGAGWRMFWHPQKVAFRAGYADAGGQFDEANIGYYSWAGGALSQARGNYAFAMGNQNLAEAQCSMALGSGNRVYGSGSAFGTCGLAIGLNNDVLDQAGVAMGQSNHSDGDAAVAIGYFSTADADYSMAFGYRASTNGHTGAKVFSDASTTDSLEAVANNEFAVRAAGGFRFRSNATLTNGCNIAAGGAAITCSSSRTLKENYQALDAEDVLARLRSLRVESWNYIDEGAAVRHIGPYAEDFYRAFGVGTDSLSIGHIDEAGVTIAGVQALAERTDALRAENATLRADLAALRAENAALQTAQAALDGRLAVLEERSGIKATVRDGGTK